MKFAALATKAAAAAGASMHIGLAENPKEKTNRLILHKVKLQGKHDLQQAPSLTKRFENSARESVSSINQISRQSSRFRG